MVAAVLFASLSPLRGLRRFYMTFLNEEREREREREKRDTRDKEVVNVCLFDTHFFILNLIKYV